MGVDKHFTKRKDENLNDKMTFNHNFKLITSNLTNKNFIYDLIESVIPNNKSQFMCILKLN